MPVATLPQDVVDFEDVGTPEVVVPEETQELAITRLTGEEQVALETKVGGALAAFNETLTDDDLREDRINPAQVMPVDDSASQKEQDSVKPEEGEEEHEENVLEPEKAGEDEIADSAEEEAGNEEEAAVGVELNDGAPTLPDSMRRSLYAYGWSDDDINTNLNALGAPFVETAARLHANRNQETTSWAVAGRQARDARRAAEDADAPALAFGRETPAQSPKGLSPVDIDGLKSQFGETELIEAIAGPVNQVIEQINQVLPQVQKGHEAVQEAGVQALMTEIDTFFGHESLKPYAEVYGNGEKALTPEQTQHRNLVLEEADALMTGAGLQGRKLTVQESLIAAHDHVAAEFKETAVRTSIKKVAKTRNRGITQKPSKRTKAAPTGPLTRSQLEEVTETRLAKAFG